MATVSHAFMGLKMESSSSHDMRSATATEHGYDTEVKMEPPSSPDTGPATATEHGSQADAPDATEHRQRWAAERCRLRKELQTKLWALSASFVLGRDDSWICDDDYVYVVDHQEYGFDSPIQEIDYFHGILLGEPMASLMDDKPMAQMMDDKEIRWRRLIGVEASAMIGLYGKFARCVLQMQLKFRARRALRFERTMHAVGILLAKAWASNLQLQQKGDGWWLWQKRWTLPWALLQSQPVLRDVS